MHPVDEHVGKMIRARRIEIGLLQEELANLLRLSAQQIQKYETGVNRVSASRLYEIGRILDVPIDYFFADMDIDHSDMSGPATALLEVRIDAPAGELIDTHGAHHQIRRIERAFKKIHRPALREKIVDLIEEMSSTSDKLQ